MHAENVRDHSTAKYQAWDAESTSTPEFGLHFVDMYITLSFLSFRFFSFPPYTTSCSPPPAAAYLCCVPLTCSLGSRSDLPMYSTSSRYKNRQNKLTLIKNLSASTCRDISVSGFPLSGISLSGYPISGSQYSPVFGFISRQSIIYLPVPPNGRSYLCYTWPTIPN